MIVESIVTLFLNPHLNKVFLVQVAVFSAKKDILVIDSASSEPVVLNFFCIIIIFLVGLFYYYQIMLPEVLFGGWRWS